MEKKRISLGSLMVIREVLTRDLEKIEGEIVRKGGDMGIACVLMARRAELERAIDEIKLIEIDV